MHSKKKRSDQKNGLFVCLLTDCLTKERKNGFQMTWGWWKIILGEPLKHLQVLLLKHVFMILWLHFRNVGIFSSSCPDQACPHHLRTLYLAKVLSTSSLSLQGSERTAQTAWLSVCTSVYNSRRTYFTLPYIQSSFFLRGKTSVYNSQ